MIRIVKGNLVNTVSKSAFNNYFKSQGWDIVKGDDIPPIPVLEEEKVIEEPVETIEAEEVIEDDSDEWNDVLEELQDEEIEKPLSEMNKKELMEKAQSLGVNVKGLETNKQLREAIKAYNK